ncbi:D-arabinono-1,4-lactone oxidase [Mycobacterium leprae]|uniref:D-arabinono-1,4-lactone oxidase n=1 Tax=Mycobacterium leprae TaxID=1769 RepID=UPI0002F90C1E|nr:D-arabinono-1,4-lactone oxidase [Mycobacterium leprae]
MYAIEWKVKFTEMKYSIPYGHIRVAIQQIVDLVRRHNLPIMFPLEVRLAVSDDVFTIY